MYNNNIAYMNGYDGEINKAIMLLLKLASEELVYGM